MIEPLLFSTGATAFAAFVLATTFRNVSTAVVSADYKPCAGDWHEAVLNHCAAGLIRIPQQPVNTYTNLMYLAAGAYVAVAFGTAPALAFAFLMLYLCIGSSLYHALSTRWAGMHDVVAIYAVYCGLLVFSLAVLLDVSDHLTAFLMLGLAGLCAFLLAKRYHRDMHLKIGVFLGSIYLVTVVHLWRTGDWASGTLLVVSFGLFLMAFLCWNLDKRRWFPLKRWGHGAWHLCTGAATGVLFYALHLAP